MNEETLKYYYDALLAARAIERFASGKTFEEYCGDDLLSSAIERKFEIVGEALNRIRKISPRILKSLAITLLLLVLETCWPTPTIMSKTQLFGVL